MNRFWITGLVVSVAIGGLANTRAESPQQDSPGAVAPLMQMKLDKSKSILEGLTLEDFELMAKNARWLKLLSMESGWNVIQTEAYAEQSRQFRRAADDLIKASTAKDVDGATTAYVNLTVRCVKCHSYMRAHRAQEHPAP